MSFRRSIVGCVALGIPRHGRQPMLATPQGVQLFEIASRCSQLRLAVRCATNPQLPARIVDEFRDLVWILARAERSEAMDANALEHLSKARAAAERGLVIAVQVAGAM